MIGRDANGRVSWETLSIMGTLVVSIMIGAIWLGSLEKQVDVNTARLKRIEDYIDEIRVHDADTLARENQIERRLNRLEGEK